MNETERIFADFLTAHTSPATPAYAEAEKWQREGWTWGRVVAEWHVGADILWAALWMGLIDADTARCCASDCVDRCVGLAPDVCAVSDAVKRGEMTKAAFGAACIVGNAEGKETEIPKDGKEPIIPAAEDVEIAGKAKAMYAATLLLDNSRLYMAMSHAVQAKVFEARGAWAEAIKANASKAEIDELEAGIERVGKLEAKAHADAVRAMLGGLK